MNNHLKKRWISLYVENQVGVLSKISGLFSGKCYNLEESDRRNNGRSDGVSDDAGDKKR